MKTRFMPSKDLMWVININTILIIKSCSVQSNTQIQITSGKGRGLVLKFRENNGKF